LEEEDSDNKENKAKEAERKTYKGAERLHVFLLAHLYFSETGIIVKFCYKISA
jgi:hypothetical protein